MKIVIRGGSCTNVDTVFRVRNPDAEIEVTDMPIENARCVLDDQSVVSKGAPLGSLATGIGGAVVAAAITKLTGLT